MARSPGQASAVKAGSFRRRLRRYQGLQEIERPLIGVLTRMEHAGVLVDAARLKRQSSELALAMQSAEEAAHAAAGGPFNIGSPKQLQEVMYERLSLPVLGKTPTGQPSTAEDVLQELAAQYELPRRVLEYRALAKLKSTYTDKLPLEIEPQVLYWFEPAGGAAADPPSVT
mgnify:CR=1 FL=1